MSSRPYLCPICRSNRTQFELVLRLARAVVKDPETGEITYESNQMELLDPPRGPEREVRCQRCGYTGVENLFVQAALRADRSRVPYRRTTR
ncbi:hypothetical protein [Limnochorda pilosa]|uniref:DNA alkylation repair protein n=1 Tax=Limnochorda pilosa TaxID=1555112 RepID=A0A0K2SPJ9_LIMPI|nr:hypothetical protein [Limnochorda pilosa]BAS28927.1 DNA alkylation repair protein [Limnochorda pilosa]